MKKKLSIALIAIFQHGYSQVGVNTKSPSTTLHINPVDINLPKSNEGLIIPRVKSLNINATKPTGLLVFLDSNDNEERGFWYWDKNQWNPFISKNMLSEDRSALVFNSKTNFDEGSYTITSTNTRTITFQTNGLIPNIGNHAYVNSSNGKIVIQDTGKYDISGIVTLNVIADNRYRRDSYEFNIRVNGVNSTVRSSYGFPSSGTTFNLTNSIALGGVLSLNAGDVIDIYVNRYNLGNDVTGAVVGATNTMLTSVVPNLTNLTLRYIAN